MVFVLISGAAAVYFVADNFNGHGSWTVLSPNEITMVDAEGNLVRIRGDYRMDVKRMNAFERWLESNGLSRQQN